MHIVKLIFSLKDIATLVEVSDKQSYGSIAGAYSLTWLNVNGNRFRSRGSLLLSNQVVCLGVESSDGFVGL